VCPHSLHSRFTLSIKILVGKMVLKVARKYEKIARNSRKGIANVELILERIKRYLV
jgi:hypothetical protein